MLNHSKIDEGSILQLSPPLQRVHRHVRDLITIACEAYTRTPLTSLCLTRCEYVSDEKHEGRFCMHLNVLVRDRERSDAIPISLTIIAEV